MTDQPSYAQSFDPDAFTRAFTRSFLDALAADLPDVPSAEPGLLVAAEQLQQAHPDLAADPAARANLWIGALLLATYRHFQSSLPRDQLLRLLQTAFTQPMRGTILAGTRAMLDQAPDPFEALVGVSKTREEYAYGTGFSIERVQDDAHAYFTNIRRCLWHTFFVDHGAPELTPLLCAWDANWSDAVDPSRHGVRFERPTTLGFGGDCCRFWFVRTDRQADTR